MRNSDEGRQILKDRFKTFMVIPIDMDKLNKDIDANFKAEVAKAKDSSLVPKIKEGEVFEVRRKLAMVKDTIILIEGDCTGEIIEEDIKLEAYSRIKSKDGVSTMGFVPTFGVSFSIDELLKDYGQEPVTLETFMGDRFGYNNRITTNMDIIANEAKIKKNQRKTEKA